jgi:DNA-binding NtrC family response regulator
LIVEDEEIARLLYKRLLDRMPVRYDIVSSIGDAQRRIAEADGYDLLVTDLRLPDGRGTDLLEEFHRRFPQARVLIITGSPELSPSATVPDVLPGTEWLFKPFELEDFNGALQRLLPKT